MTSKSLLANLLDSEQSRTAGLELVFSSSDEDDDFLGDGGLFENKDVHVDDGGVARLPQQVAKKRRTRYARLCKTESNWWKFETTRNSDGCSGFPTMSFTGCFCLLQFQSGSLHGSLIKLTAGANQSATWNSS